MHWMRKVDLNKGVVIFSVLRGYNMRTWLKQKGFRYDPRSKKWVCTVSQSQVTRIEEIEEVLKASETRDEKWPFPYTVRG